VDAANFSVNEKLRDGGRVTIRSLRPEDRSAFMAAVAQTGSQSIHRRFFTPRRNFSESETSYFVDVDFVKYVALIAAVEADGESRIVGGGRYIVGQPGEAELAFMVVDRYQGRIGKALLRHLIAIARHGDLRELNADVLADNTAMLKVFEGSGFQVGPSREPGTRHFTFQL
jgi:ribosomal protein S18 acetylase RimI-like enzyme